jgi:hypothetical protein
MTAIMMTVHIKFHIESISIIITSTELEKRKDNSP